MAETLPNHATRPQSEATMTAMPIPPAHAKPKDHLWVLILIAACALIETFPSWVGIGAVSGFPRFGRMPTDWTLAVTSEAYWGYALYAGIVAVAGPRSRAFALWSAAAVFVLSLMGQASYHLMAAAHRTVPPQWVVVFVAALPVIVLALIAVLVHLRHIDRAEAAEAEQAQREAARVAAAEAAEASELAAVRADLEAARAASEEAHADLSAARTELARTVAKVAALERKLAAQKPKRTRTQAPAARRTKASGAAPHAVPGAEDRTLLPDDFDARGQALDIWLANPEISGKELAAAVGMKERWGQLRKAEFAAMAPAGQDPEDSP
jgi:hypothetical protein